MTGFEKVWMRRHRWLWSEWRWAGRDRIFGAVSTFIVSCLWTDSGWRSLSVGFFTLGNSPPAQVKSTWKTSLWPAGVYFSLASLETTQGLSDELFGLLLHFISGENSVKCSCYPACSGAPVPSPFSVLSCETLQSVSVSTRLHCVKLCYTQLQELGWDLQIHFHMQLKPRLFLRCSGIEKKIGMLRANHVA